MIIAFYNLSRGVGTTTLAAHTCVLAHELGLRVAGFVTWENDLARWLGPTPVPCARRSNDFGEPDADLLVLDVERDQAPPLPPDVWVLPIADDDSAAEAREVSDQLSGPLIWLGNMGYTIEERPAYLADEIVMGPEIPYSRALRKAGEQRRIVWSEPALAGAPGAKALRESLTDVIHSAFAATGESLETCVLLGRLRRAEEDLARLREEFSEGHRRMGVQLTALLSSAGLRPAEPAPTTEPSRAGSVAGLGGLDLLVRQAQAQLAGKPCPLDADPRRAAEEAAPLTFDTWSTCLRPRDHELASGLTDAAQLVEQLDLGPALAVRAQLCPATIARTLDRPHRARLDTLVRLAVAAGRADLLRLQPRHPATAQAHVHAFTHTAESPAHTEH